MSEPFTREHAPLDPAPAQPTSADFLLELLSEEIPARMQARARNDLARMFAEELGKAGIEADGIETFATPRRLGLIARGLPLATAAVSEEIKGPRASAPPQALEGFLRKTGLSQEQLVERDGVYFAVIDKPGQPTAAVLGGAIERIIRNFPWPKSMRWGAASASTSLAALGSPVAGDRRAARRRDRAGRGRGPAAAARPRSGTASTIPGRSRSAGRATMPRSCAPAMSSSTPTSARRSSATAPGRWPPRPG